LRIAQIARTAGAPKVAGAGVDLHHKLGDNVKAGDVLYTVYAQHHTDLMFAQNLCNKDAGYVLGQAQDLLQAFVEF
jgi:thymidine phosphorylase